MWISKAVIGPFKKHKNPVTYVFSQLANSLWGDNRTGKTTVKEAVAFCLYGTDVKGGNTGLEKLYNNDQKAEYHRVPAGLESKFDEWSQGKPGTFIDKLNAFRTEYGLAAEQPYIEASMWVVTAQGDQHVVSRRRSFKGSTTLKMDSTTISNRDLIQVLLPSPALFFSVFLNGYFFDQKEVKQREILSRYMAKVDYKVVMKHHAGVLSGEVDALLANTGTLDHAMETTKRRHLDLVSELSDLNAEQRVLVEDVAKLSGASADVSEELQVVRNQFSDLNTRIGQFVRIRDDLKRIESVNLERAKFNADLKRQAQQIRDTNTTNQRRLVQIQERLSQLGTPVEPVNQAPDLFAASKGIQVPSLALPQRPDRKQITLEQPPLAGNLWVCPKCGEDLEAWCAQELANTSRHNESTKAKAEAEYAEACTSWELTCKALTDKHSVAHKALFDEKASLGMQSDAAQAAYNNALREFHRATAEITSLQHEITAVSKALPEPTLQEMLPPPPDVPSDPMVVQKDIDDTQKQMDTLAQRQSELTRIAGEATGRNQMAEEKKQRLASLPVVVKEKSRSLILAKDLRKLVEDVPTLMVKAQLDSVREFIPHMDMTFYSEVKETGELKKELTFYYDGTPYGVLSNSERVKLCVELATLLNLLSSKNIPIFVDNAESVTRLPKALGKQQYFAAYVSKDHQELVVAGRQHGTSST